MFSVIFPGNTVCRENLVGCVVWPSRHCGSLCVAADEKWSELFNRCYSQLLGTTSVTAQAPLPTPELTQRFWQNIAATLNNASTSSYR